MSAKTYSRQLDTTPTTPTTTKMMHFANHFNNQRRLRTQQIFKRARLNRTGSINQVAAAPAAAAYTPPRHDNVGIITSDTASLTPVSNLTDALHKELVEIGRH